MGRRQAHGLGWDELDGEREARWVGKGQGPVDNPNANTFQVLGGLIRNAFVKAILPGFQHQLAQLDPMAFRVVRKQQQKDEQAALRP